MIKNTKVFDVIPPKEGKSLFSKEIKKEIAPVKKNQPKKIRHFDIKNKLEPKKISLCVIGAIVIIMLLGWIFIKPKAEIEIWPKKEQIQDDLSVVVYAGEKVNGEIPGEILEVTKSVSNTFESSSTKLKTAKASGTITIYNSYSNDSQTLITNTRFVSGDGKLFRSQQKIEVPGYSYQSGKLTPGSVDITVVADQPGEEYNIEATTFSLPGLSGGASYTSIYAKSFSPMSGGVSQEVPQITEEDIQRAEENLAAQALAESKIALEEILRASGDYIVLSEAISQEITSFTANGEVGQEIASFSAQADSLGKAMVFKKQDVREFAKNYILSIISSGKVLHENSLQVEYIVEEVSIDENKIELTLQITADTYQEIDQVNLKETVKDKNPEAISRILKDYSQIQKAQVNLWPFWAKRSPNSSERIDIEIKLD
jgi:hypothetical protein